MWDMLDEWGEWMHRHFIVIEFATCAIALGIIAYGYLQYTSLATEYQEMKVQLASTTAVYKKVTSDLREKFEVVVGRNTLLSDSLAAEQTKNDLFQAQLNGVKTTVDQLKKLSETDKELLQKYSKVYFLNENYVPMRLSTIDQRYLANTDAVMQFHTDALPSLTRMIDNAKSAGIDLKILSAYRDFGTQAALKAEYKVSYGSGANKFSADQGYSEHQLGTTLDFTTTDIGNSFSTKFESSDSFTWLTQHAHEYGFVLSYPKGNSFYVYEPWHWRYIGTALATRLHSENKNFYDMDQREIDKYLVLIFN